MKAMTKCITIKTSLIVLSSTKKAVNDSALYISITQRNYCGWLTSAK